MTTAQDQLPSWSAPARRGPITLGRGSLIMLVLVIIAIGASTTYRSDTAPRAGEQAKFDPANYGAQTYEPKVVPAIQKRAIDIVTLHKAIAADPDAAGQKYGARDGTGPYSFAVSLTGTADKPESGLLKVEVPGLDDGTRVSVQIGPAVNGTALRDAAGFIKFGQFTNQVDYADAGTALNNQVKAKVLASLDPDSIDGKKVTVVGAMTPLTADVLTVTPISIEVAS
jgi:predicted lipoprotein